MNVEMHGPISDALKDHTQARLAAALGQHQSHVEHVRVRLDDLNGPRGGIDKRCQLTIQLHRSPDVFIDERGDDLYAVISLAADRAKNAVGKVIEKQRDKRRVSS